ncbi:MAG: radical SAM/SPASM domain-containing protein [bacterium]
MNLSTLVALRFFAQGVINYFTNRPLVVSFEVTHSCTANCHHCDKGGIRSEVLATPERYRAIYEEIRPVVAQISGGEPLLRDDVLDIVRALKNPGDLPYIVLITNGSLLTPEKFLKLKRAGVDQFGISLDFPDKRHDENRRLPGLYRHLSELIPRLSEIGNNDISLITTITRENLPRLVNIVNRAEEWNVFVNFSAYTKLRTTDTSFLISSEKDLKLLRETANKLIELKRKDGRIITSEYVLRRYVEFFENGAIPNCQAGKRCFVVNPDGSMFPCAMKRDVRYWSQKELIEKFSKNNDCGKCYVSMRANTEKSIGQILKDTLSLYGIVKRRKG